MTTATLDAPSRRPPPWALGILVFGVALIVVALVSGLFLIPRFQAANPATPLQRSDADQVGLDDLYLDLTLVTPAFLESRRLGRYLGDRDPSAVLPVLVGLNTHTGTIEHMHHLPNNFSLLSPSGQRYPSLSEPIVLSQHHNAYLLLFPARDHTGVPFLDQTTGALVVEATDLGLRPTRRFEWPLPIEDGSLSAGDWGMRLVLILALLSALLVVLSPCALELTLYYSAIISCTVTEAERAAAADAGLDPGSVGRTKVLINLGAFVAGFTLLYAASGATVGLIGEGVRQPLGAYGEIFQVVGGLIIIFFALRVAGLHRWLMTRVRRFGAHGDGSNGQGALAAVWLRLRRWPGRSLTALRARGQAGADEAGGMRARDSFLVGMGLSSACVTCMGGAVLYPLLVYAGITSWYSGLVTLGLYSLAIAVPMVLIALGFVRIRISLAKRLGLNRVLRFTSAALLAAIGLMILSGRERIITDVTFRFMAEITTWVA